MFWGFRVIDSLPIILRLHLDPKKSKHTSVPFHNLNLNVTIYNHYWTRPFARVHSGSITFENTGRGCTHENSAGSLFVVTRRSEHTVTCTALMRIHIIAMEGKQIQPQNRTVMATENSWWPQTVKSSFLKYNGCFTWHLFVTY